MSTTGVWMRVDPALREHRRRFRINGPSGSKVLASALKTMEKEEEAILLALDRVGCSTGTRTALAEMRAALRMLVEGPDGSFR